MKQKVKINFSDFWPGFDCRDNYFTRLLSPRFQLEFSDSPDFLIYSVFGQTFREHGGIRIFYSGENWRPDFRECDYAFTFDHMDDPRHYRLPLYAFCGDLNQLVQPADFDPEASLREKTHFCNFVYSNSSGSTSVRTNFFLRLSRYKRVDSGGRYLNNIGGPVVDKRQFLARYKFTLAFENSSHPGYTTEKMVDPMFANSIPVHWGNELIASDFNSKSFISYYDFADEDELIEYLLELDGDDDRYLEYVRQPYFNNNVLNQYVDPVNVLAQFERIFTTPVLPVATR